jgi:hypothetical protein
VLDAHGERSIHRAERDAIVGDLELDLLVDMTCTHGRCHPARRRELDGANERVLLPVFQALTLIELVRAARPLRPRDITILREIHSHAPVRLVERMRKTIDVVLPGKRGSWRCIHTVVGALAEAKAFHWQPPCGMRWAIVLPGARAPHRP